ncbi:efflux RND transporter periplasmic adaptor subunit [Pseudoalteromonas aurantia]|uniref:Efflux transporter periplasmic adaptor subunit n=1 Tax=Pseudoalteromonas aurantia TaxID=43654 RepID=A0A5S3UZB8_9GAMM|nr:efflux RND transporter periplasmic adaptor subunit [Pseudoalteromonas aurantia]TMO63214.1 efflux transporter periplasmic adaptor subunit [Pseudoalteromonas aurantia]TMO71099.1 efflux transporter periplasmic adaptor subunit [Pseudoalteromonas aurantia]
MYAKQSGKALFPFIILVLICISGYLYFPASQGKSTNTKRGATAVTTVSAQEQSRIITIAAIGNARANQAIDIVSSQNDYVSDVYFTDGDMVLQNDKLIQLQDIEEKLAVKELTIRLKEQQRQLARLTELAKTQSAAQSALEEQRSVADALFTQLQSAKVELAQMTVTAPFKGVLGKRLISVGSFVDNNTRITTLDDISVIKVDFQVPEKYLGQLKKGMTVKALSDAYGTTPFDGVISHIDPRIDETTRTVQITADFTNEHTQLKPGMLLHIIVELRALTAIMVPEKSIIPRKGQHYVFVINNENKAQLTEVELHTRFSGWVAIKNGLAIGQKIVSEGTTKIRSGSAVTEKG